MLRVVVGDAVLGGLLQLLADDRLDELGALLLFLGSGSLAGRAAKSLKVDTTPCSCYLAP